MEPYLITVALVLMQDRRNLFISKRQKKFSKAKGKHLFEIQFKNYVIGMIFRS